jgi:hypothetical protein
VSVHIQTRREFLIISGLLATSAATTARAQATQAPLVRKNLATLNANSPDIQAFSTAYQAMLKISQNDPNDPHGWIYQANIHGVDPSNNTGPDGVWPVLHLREPARLRRPAHPVPDPLRPTPWPPRRRWP